MARSQQSASTLLRRQMESEIASLRQQISVCQNEISLREKVLHDLDALDGRTPTGLASKTQPAPIVGRVGLTDAMREIFRCANTELSAPEIRERLVSSGFAPRSNFLVMIHSTLSRLEKAGEIEKRLKTGKWVAVGALRSDASEKQALVLVPAHSTFHGERQEITAAPSIATERSVISRADKVELIVKLRREGKTNKEIAKALGMDTHAFQCYVTTLIKRGLLQKRDPGRRSRSVPQAAGENL